MLRINARGTLYIIMRSFIAYDYFLSGFGGKSGPRARAAWFSSVPASFGPSPYLAGNSDADEPEYII